MSLSNVNFPERVIATALLLQKFTVLKNNGEFYPEIAPDTKHTDIIQYAVENTKFKDTREYFHFRNEVFYVDSLLTNVELDVGINIVLKEIKPYKDYTKDDIIKKILLHPLVIKERNKNIPAITRAIGVPLQERKFMKYIHHITEIDFQTEVTLACNHIIRETETHGEKFYAMKAKIINFYVNDYFEDSGVKKLLAKDPQEITKYLLANTSSIVMESLQYEEGGLGVFGIKETEKPKSFQIGLDEDEIQIAPPPQPHAPSIPVSNSVFGELDDLLNHLKK